MNPGCMIGATILPWPTGRATPLAELRENDADRLDALVVASAGAGIAREALWLRLSALPKDLAAPRHVRLAADAMAPLITAPRARRFALPNGDLVLVWRGAAPALIAECLAGLRHLFADEPDLLPDPKILLRDFHLPHDAATLRLLIGASQQSQDPQLPTGDAATRLNAAGLQALEANLAHADVARFARRRQVCHYRADAGFAPAWEVRLLSVREIAETLAPGTDLQADPWLFRRLTRSFDRRLLVLLAATDELRDAGPFGLNLNVGSLLAPEFLRFDAALPARLRGHVIIGIDQADLIADFDAFCFARDFARARQYRLLLRSLTPAAMALYAFERLGFDLLQLQWTPDWATASAALKHCNPASLVLSHTNTVAALAWGSEQGIRLFQGAIVAAPPRR